MSLAYLRRRLLLLVPAVAGILLVAYALIELAPGDPLFALAGESGDAEYYAFIREKFGLDRPPVERFLRYAGTVLRGDLGTSYVQGRPVIEIILERVPPTLLLTSVALVLSTVAGLALGAFAATRYQRLPDVAISIGTLTLDAAPIFWLGQLAIIVFALQLGWVPVQGVSSPETPDGLLAGTLDLLHHLALPAIVLSVGETAAVARIARVGFVEELAQDYVRTARSKGLTEVRVVGIHAARRALLPVVTLIGSRVGHLISGAVVVEVIFGWPGVGRLLIAAMQTRDVPLVLGIFIVVAFSVVIANLITDLIYGSLDPRIRHR